VKFIDLFHTHRENDGLIWRVEPLCKVLTGGYGVQISESGYYAYKHRGKSARLKRDEALGEKITRIFNGNYQCYGIRKVWRTLLNEGEAVARCTVERLMKQLGLRGVVRGKVKRTTIAGDKVSCAQDLVKRDFNANTPNSLWVADFTYISTWVGWVYVAFILDVFARRIVGYCVSALMNKQMVTTAFKRAVFTRVQEGATDFTDLIHHNDKGSQYTADNFVELLALHGVRASIGSAGDAYDNALAESIIGIFKTELIKRFGPWRDLGQLTLETARWVHWYNNQRISEHNDYKSPVEIERLWYTTGVDHRMVLKSKS
jgi:putative transposase